MYVYLYTKAKILIDWLVDWLIEASRRPIQNSYVCKLWYTEKKIKSFWHKKLSHWRN